MGGARPRRGTWLGRTTRSGQVSRDMGRAWCTKGEQSERLQAAQRRRGD